MSTLPGLPLPLDFAPMEAKLVENLPTDPGWRFEPKWDGFRCLAFRSGEAVDLRAKSGKPLARYFPDVTAVLKALPVERFILDGELTIPVNGELSFDALQMRLHPAESRVRRLAAETPAASSALLFAAAGGRGRREGRSLAGAPLSNGGRVDAGDLVANSFDTRGAADLRRARGCVSFDVSPGEMIGREKARGEGSRPQDRTIHAHGLR